MIPSVLHIKTWLDGCTLMGLFIFFFVPCPLCRAEVNHHAEKDKKVKREEPPKIGNFTLPPSQEPSPLISFGQRIIDKNQTLFLLFADDFSGVSKHSVDMSPSILYGISDDLTVSFNVPIAASYKTDKDRSSGLEDLSLQFEYAFYVHDTASFREQATVVTSITFPTGSSKKQPPTGFGSSSFFLGATFNRMYTDWFGFTSYGVILTTSHESTKFGNEFLYQCGLGKNIFTIESEWIFAWMVEVDGTYTEKNKIKSKTDSNSGGNVVYVTPSLWLSSKKFIVQLGFGLPATQHLFGNQKRDEYLLSASFGWAF
jgi:hypothetical protein